MRVCWGVDNAVTASLDCYSPARITDGDTIVWETTGSADPAVQAILDQYIAIADNVGDGVAAMLERLSAFGTHVVETSPGRFQVQHG